MAKNNNKGILHSLRRIASSPTLAKNNKKSKKSKKSKTNKGLRRVVLLTTTEASTKLKTNTEEIMQCVREYAENEGVLDNRDDLGGCLLKRICELMVRADEATKYGSVSTFGSETVRLVNDLGNLMNRFSESEKLVQRIQDLREETEQLEQKLTKVTLSNEKLQRKLERAQGNIKLKRKLKMVQKKYGATLGNLQTKADNNLRRVEKKHQKKQEKLERLQQRYKKTIQTLQETANDLDQEMTEETRNCLDDSYSILTNGYGSDYFSDSNSYLQFTYNNDDN